MFGHTKAQEGGLAHPKCPLPLITLIDTWIRTMRTRPSVAHTTEKSRQGQCRPCCVAGGMGVLCILDPFCVLYHVFCIPVPGRSPGAGRLRRTARWRKTCPLLRICKYPSLFAMVDEYPMTSHVFVPGLRKNCNRNLDQEFVLQQYRMDTQRNRTKRDGTRRKPAAPIGRLHLQQNRTELGSAAALCFQAARLEPAKLLT